MFDENPGAHRRASRAGADMSSAVDQLAAQVDLNRPAARIGADCVQVARVERAITRWGPRFLQRNFTPVEIEYCTGKAFPARHFAGRLAAKEAVYKLLGIRWEGNPLTWRDIEIVHGGDGRPRVVMHRAAQMVAHRAALTDISVSITHTDDYAMAVAVGSVQNRPNHAG